MDITKRTDDGSLNQWWMALLSMLQMPTRIYTSLDINGGLVWKFKAKNLLWSTPLVMNGVVYLASMDHYLYAIECNALAKRSGKQIVVVRSIGNPVNADGDHLYQHTGQ